MAHAHESNTKRIWIVFGILSVITIVEVLFGIYKPKSLFFTNFLGMNLCFILLVEGDYVYEVFKTGHLKWIF